MISQSPELGKLVPCELRLNEGFLTVTHALSLAQLTESRLDPFRHVSAPTGASA